MLNRTVADQRVHNPFVTAAALMGRAGKVSTQTSITGFSGGHPIHRAAMHPHLAAQFAGLPACLKRGRHKAGVSTETRGARRKVKLHLVTRILIAAALFSIAGGTARAQPGNGKESGENGAPLAAGKAEASVAAAKTGETSERERALVERIERLERRLAELEARTPGNGISEPSHAMAKGLSAAELSSETSAPVRDGGAAALPQAAAEDRAVLDFFRDTTINLTVDGYYGYNFNKPVGRINLLRANDVSSNSFSLNQAALVVERAPDVEAGRRFGLRLDLQYGQATEGLQGSAANELRPQAYRNIWQAYGTYVAPIGSGLTVDFGKFAANLGYETSYTRDNFNYSRAYFFTFLPFYHFGLRAKYPFNEKLAVQYQLVNGTQQSEDFNGFKSQEVSLILTPARKVAWQINYYVGREQRDVVAILNPTYPSLPTEPGLPTDVIRPESRGRFHVLDTYVTLNATDNLTLAFEADYVINRVEEFSSPTRVTGGAAYARYQFTPRFALAARAEYLSDRGGLFSGVTQALKETTLTADFRLADGFLMRGEWRRDFSNQEFFLTEVPGVSKSEQNTATLGVIWWLGRKEGSW
jgi:Putative beta-barrel porin-2, OmpL-like. bbp2